MRLTPIGGSRPRGPNSQIGFAGALRIVTIGAPPLLVAITGETLGGGAPTVTPAHEVEAEGAAGRTMSFSVRNILLKLMLGSPVALSSRTVGGPSRIVIRP